MNNSLTAGLTSDDLDHWGPLADAYGLDGFPTGGLPAIPANAENTGIVDPRTLAIGTVINVYTQSASKFVLTIVEDGELTIERFAWEESLSGDMRHLSYADRMEVYKVLLRRYEEHLDLEKQGYDVNVGFEPLHPSNAAFNPSTFFQIANIKAGEQMFIYRGGRQCTHSGPVAFWSIDLPE